MVHSTRPPENPACCGVDVYPPPSLPDNSSCYGVDVYHPPRPPHTCSDPDETSVKVSLPNQSDISVIDPSIDSKVFSVHASNTADNLSVPAHFQELFDKALEATQLSLSNKQSLASVLRRNSCAFATDSQDMGFCTALQHDIDIGEARPIKQPPRRFPLFAREAEDAILSEMLESGVIEPSNSPWSSPVCMVRKKDGAFPFFIDYQKVNDVTKKDAFPVSDVKDALDSLCGARYFATIDLLSGYWQLSLTDRAKERSAFLYPPRAVSVYPHAVRIVKCTIHLLPFDAHCYVRSFVHSVSLLSRRYHRLCR